MSADKYPLCKAAGLDVLKYGDGTPVFRAIDVERLLESAPVVCAHAGPSTRGLEDPVWIAKHHKDADATHSARLLMVTPLKQDSAEDLLREIVSTIATSSFANNKPSEVGINDPLRLFEILKRARKLLDSKKPDNFDTTARRNENAQESRYDKQPAQGEAKCTCKSPEGFILGKHLQNCPAVRK